MGEIKYCRKSEIQAGTVSPRRENLNLERREAKGKSITNGVNECEQYGLGSNFVIHI